MNQYQHKFCDFFPGILDCFELEELLLISRSDSLVLKLEILKAWRIREKRPRVKLYSRCGLGSDYIIIFSLSLSFSFFETNFVPIFLHVLPT